MDPANIPNLSNTDPAYLDLPVTSIVRTSIFLASMWEAFLILYFTVQMLPFLLSRFIIIHFGYCSEVMYKRLEIFPAIHKWLTCTLTMILSVVIYRIVFAQLNFQSSWRSGLSFLLMMMVLSIVLLAQRIIVQKIAFDFNAVAYNERLEQSRLNMELIDKLKKAVKKFGVLDLLDKDIILGAASSSAGGPKMNSSSSAGGPKMNSMDLSSGDSPRKKSVPNIVHFFTSANNQAPSPPPPLEESFSFTQVPLKRAESLERTKSLDRKTFESTRPSFSSDGSPIKSNDNIVVMIPTASSSPSKKDDEDDSPTSPPAKPPPSPKARKKTLDRSNESFKSDTTTLTEVRIGGVKKRDRLEFSGDHEAKKLSMRLWSSLRVRNSKEITVAYFYPLFLDREDAHEVFAMLDADKNESLSLEEIHGTLAAIYKEKKDLNSSLNDLSHALGHLNTILYGCSITLTLLLALPIYEISFNAILPFTSLFLALSFIFGGASKNAFDCIVFLFIRHAFDSGDRVIIDDKQYLVLELALLETTLKSDGKVVYYPNSLLSNKHIINIRRSKDLTDNVRIHVPFTVTEEKMRQLQQRMIVFCKTQSTRLKPNTTMDIIDIGPNVTYQFSLEYKGNWQDAAQRWNTRTMFMFELKRAMAEFEIPQVQLD